MEVRSFWASLLVTVVIASATIAAPAEGKVQGNQGGGNATFEPEFVYSKNGGTRPDQIRLANRTDTTEVTIDTINENIAGLDLSRDDVGLIAFSTAQGNLYLQRWHPSPNFSFDPPQQVYPTSPSTAILSPDFSADGSKLAFITTDGGLNFIYVCNVSDLISRSPTACSRQDHLTGWGMYGVRFDPTGNTNTTLFFFGQPYSNTKGIYRYTVGGSAPGTTPLISDSYFNDSFDIGRTAVVNPPLIVSDNGGNPVFFRLDGTLVTPTFAGHGYIYHFNCRNDALVYTETGASGHAFDAVTAFGGPIQQLTMGWSKSYDWMPRASCQ
jgi:hypothetical protein